jgi:hypothetical protein
MRPYTSVTQAADGAATVGRGVAAGADAVVPGGSAVGVLAAGCGAVGLLLEITASMPFELQPATATQAKTSAHVSTARARHRLRCVATCRL